MKDKRGNAVLIAAIVFLITVALLAVLTWGTVGFTEGNVTHWFNGWGRGIQPAPAPAVYAPVHFSSVYACFNDFEDRADLELDFSYGGGDTYGKFIGYHLRIDIDESFSKKVAESLSFDVDFKFYSITDDTVEIEPYIPYNGDYVVATSNSHSLALSDFIIDYDKYNEVCQRNIKDAWYSVYNEYYKGGYNATYDADFYYCDEQGNVLDHFCETYLPCLISGSVYSL